MDKMVKDPDVKEEDMKKKRLKEKKKKEKEMQKATVEEEDSAICAGTAASATFSRELGLFTKEEREAISSKNEVEPGNPQPAIKDKKDENEAHIPRTQEDSKSGTKKISDSVSLSGSDSESSKDSEFDKICKRMLRLEKLFEIHDSKALRELEGEDGKEDEIEVADLFAKLEAKVVNALKKQNEITNSIRDTKVKEDRQHYETGLTAKEVALALGRLERQQAEMHGMVKRIGETHSKISIVFSLK